MLIILINGSRNVKKNVEKLSNCLIIKIMSYRKRLTKTFASLEFFFVTRNYIEPTVSDKRIGRIFIQFF